MVRRGEHLPSNLPPRGLTREQAAAYCGVGATKFDEMVADGRMPQAIRVDGRRIWDRQQLDQSFGALGGSEDAINPWDKVGD
jgi:predicted DNA-binding transcriptional regulator AlpA